jgi:hypothetical protein
MVGSISRARRPTDKNVVAHGDNAETDDSDNIEAHREW